MVKKVPSNKKKVRKIVRMSVMERTIEEGREYVEASKRRTRVIKPTRTMAEIAKITPKKLTKPKKYIVKSGKPSPAKLAKRLPVKKAIPSKPAKKVPVPKKATTKKKIPPVVAPVAPVVAPVAAVMKT